MSVKRNILCVWSAIAVVLLMLMPIGAQPVVDSLDNEANDGHPGLLAGPRATTIYGSHPRLLLRDTNWANGLSVANIRARCQPATQWWTQCQRVTNAGTGIAREIPTYAMKYLLNSNSADADHVITLILAADVNSNDLELLSDVSLGYDWIYNYAGFTPALKAQAASRIDQFAQNMKAYIFDRHIWSRYMGYTDSVGIAGLALYGDSPNASAFIDFALGNLTYMFQAFQYINGSWAEGFRYLNIERLPQFLEFLESYRTATVPTADYFADIRCNQGDWLRKMLDFMIYNTMPYGEIARVGDIGQGTLKDNYRRNLELITSRENDSAGGGYLQLLESIPGAQPTYYVGYAFVYILWYEPNVPTDGLDKLPRTMWFGPGSLDYVVFRNGWKTNSTVITFRSGDGFTGHEHLDNGAFTITNAHPLLIDSGMYAAWGTDHRENYYTRTIAHNAITVYDPLETFSSPYLGGNLANDGGQRVWWYYQGSSQQNDKTLADYMASKYAGTHFETGNITAYETGGDFDYVFGDYSNAYNDKVFHVSSRAKVQTVTRELAYFGSDWLIVMDHVYTLDPSFVATYNIHMINQPTVNGSFIYSDSTGGSSYDGETVTVDNGGDRLYSRTLFPEEQLITKRGGAGYEYIVDGINRNGGASPDPLAGSWRVEVQDLAQTSDHKFLHVMNIQEAGKTTSTMPVVDRIKEDNVIGAHFADKVTLFSESLTRYDHASINVTGTGKTTFYAYDMVPNKDYSILCLDKQTGVFEATKARSSNNGTMKFIFNLTGSDLVIIGAKAQGDLSITDLASSPMSPNEGETIDFSLTLHNPTIVGFDTNVTGGRVSFYDGDPAKGGVLLGNASIKVGPNAVQKVHFLVNLTWALQTRMIYALLDISDVTAFNDTNLADNKIFLPVYVNGRPVPVINAVDWAYIDTPVRFNGSKSHDPDGPIQDYRWQFGDGTVGTGKVADHTYNRTGLFVVTLKVWDLGNIMNQTSKNITITIVPKKAPVPDFMIKTDDGTGTGSIRTVFTFNSSTKDPDHITQGYLWDFGDGKKGDGPFITHRWDHYGIYNVTMTIFWNNSLNASAIKNVTIYDLPPVPVIGLTTNDTVKRFVVDFDALDSSDPDDDFSKLMFHWDFGDGATSDNDSAQHAFTSSRTYNISLTATDPRGAQGKAWADVKVTNRLPKAVIKASNTTLSWNQTLQLDGSGSSDPDSDGMLFTWDFNDNTTFGHNKTVGHMFTKEGYYTIVLTVTDTENGVGRDTVTIHQLPKPSIPPPPPPKKKKDNTMLYIGIAALIALVVALVVAVLLLVKRKGKDKGPGRTGLESDFTPGPGASTEIAQQGPSGEEVLTPDGSPGEEIPRAQAKVIGPKDTDGKEGR